MQTRTSIICGGARPRGRRKPDGSTIVLNLWESAGDRNVTLQIDDIRGPLLRSVPDRFLDFIEIATYIYCADQAVPRQADGVDTFGSEWRRDLEFHIPVRDLDFWNQVTVQATLADTVGFLSDDAYQFLFYPARTAPDIQPYLGDRTAAPWHVVPDSVMMFSGGLDSLAGAVTEAVIHKRRVVLVNHRSTPKLNRKHGVLAAALERASGAFAPTQIKVRVNKDSDLSKDHYQRARSLLYAALGGAVGHMVGVRSLKFYENGIVALNLPVSAQVVGGRATRTAHPRVMDGFQKMLTLIAGESFSVENPFLWSTRAELVKLVIEAGCGDLIAQTMSCSHTWQISNEETHCGLCSQCVDRRLGIVAASAEKWDPADQYKDDLFTTPLPKGTDRLMVAGYLERANQAGDLTSETEFMCQFPVVADIVPYVGGSVVQAVSKVMGLYQRHSKEVTTAIKLALAQNVEGLVKRTLPADGILRMVYESGGTETAPVQPQLAARRATGPELITALDKAWEPIEITWNDTPFVIEEEPRCTIAYVLDYVALEDYFPELRDDPYAHESLPHDEISDLKLLTLIGYDRTLELQIMLKERTVFCPDEVHTTNGNTLELQESGFIVLDGNKIPLRRVRVTETDASARARIDAARRANDGVRSIRKKTRVPQPSFAEGASDAAAIDAKEIAAIKKQTERIPELLESIEKIPGRTHALLNHKIGKRIGHLGFVTRGTFSASPHFKNITLDGTAFVLGKTPAVIIETLYIAQMEAMLPGMTQAEVFGQAFGADKKKWPSRNPRIQNYFRTGDAKRLWATGFITHDGKGNFSLNLKVHTHTQ